MIPPSVAYPEHPENQEIRGERRLYAEVLATAYTDLRTGTYNETDNAIWWFTHTADPNFKYYGIAYHSVVDLLNLSPRIIESINTTLKAAQQRLKNMRNLPAHEKTKKNALPLDADIRGGKLAGPRYQRPSSWL